MRKIYIFLSLIAMIMVSCTTDADPMANQDLAQSRSTPQARTPGDGKYEVLGYGYDVTGEYLVHASVRQQVIDAKKFILDYPHRFDNPFIGETSTRIYGGDNFYSYLKDVQKASGITVGAWWRMYTPDDKKTQAEKSTFSGEVNRSSQSKYSYSSKYSFARGEVIKRQRQYYIDASASILSNYLSTKFKEDLQLLSADQIVAKYGTHVLIDVELGGMQKAFLKSVITKEESTTVKTKSAKAALALNFKKFGISLGGSSSSTTTETYVKNNDYWEFSLETIGGSTNGYSISFTSKDPNPQHTINIGSWAQSVDDNHSKLVNINWESTYPLYDFIADPTKKAQIKTAVDNYIASKKKEVLEVVPLYHGWKSSKYNDNFGAGSKGLNMLRDYGYDIIGIECYILKDQVPGSVPLYHGWKRSKYNDAFRAGEIGLNELKMYDYHIIGVVGYIYSSQVDNTIPLYQGWKRKKYNNTLGAGNKGLNGLKYYEYNIIGTEGYVFSAED